jgi:hypothetical protein
MTRHALHAAPAPHSSSQSCPPACGGLAQLPGSHGGALPGPFSSRSPLTRTGPNLAVFLAGWGRKARQWWPRQADFIGDLIGAACVLALPFLLLFGVFLT